MLKINAARELNEEVGVSEEEALNNLHFIGLINDDKTEVGQVHIEWYMNVKLIRI